MRTILTLEQMRCLEQAHFRATGTPSHQLMSRAAAELTRAMDERGMVRGRRMAFVCGSGGNGGDGLEAARLCAGLGASCAVVLAMPREKFRGDALRNLNLLPESVPVLALEDAPEPDVWVDALFGIGLSRAVEGLPARCVARMNASPAPVVSVDVPSGLDALTGDAPGVAVRARLTVTFQHAKPGHFLRHGPDLCGELTIRDIGIAPELLRDVPELRPGLPLLRQVEDADVAATLPPRPRFSHKNDYGHLLLVAGSVGMAGAAAIAARAALHSGAGLVSVACAVPLLPILQALAPEAMCIPLPANARGAIGAEALPALSDALRGKDAVAVGPGLSRHAAPEVVEAVLCCGLPAVVDADALNLIALHPSMKALLGENHLITPHPGEAARLITATGREIDDALALGALGCAAVLKGSASLIACDGGLALSDAGSACMAKGGSGDMLTGIAGALLAQGMRPGEAARAACRIHGLAGEVARRALGLRYPTAMDLIAALPEVWRRWE